MQNVVDTSKQEGVVEGILKVAKQMKINGEPLDTIMKYTSLSKDQIDQF